MSWDSTDRVQARIQTDVGKNGQLHCDVSGPPEASNGLGARRRKENAQC